MNTRKKFAEGLKDMLVIEKKARDNYESDTITFKNWKVTETIKRIKLDEDVHVKMLEELISMLSPGKKI